MSEAGLPSPEEVKSMSKKNMHLVFFTEHGSNRPTRKWVTQKQFDSYVKAVRQQREKMLKQE